MAALNPVDGKEIILYYCANAVADETTGGATWVELGWSTDWSISKNRNDRDVYKKGVKFCTKPGIKEYTGSLSQMLIDYNTNVSKLFDAGDPVALKATINKDGDGITETWYFANVNFKNVNYNFGNTNDGGDVVVSCDFSYSEDHVVAA